MVPLSASGGPGGSKAPSSRAGVAREVHTRENPGRAPVIFRNHERCTPKLILGIGKKGAALGGKAG